MQFFVLVAAGLFTDVLPAWEENVKSLQNASGSYERKDKEAVKIGFDFLDREHHRINVGDRVLFLSSPNKQSMFVDGDHVECSDQNDTKGTVHTMRRTYESPYFACTTIYAGKLGSLDILEMLKDKKAPELFELTGKKLHYKLLRRVEFTAYLNPRNNWAIKSWELSAGRHKVSGSVKYREGVIPSVVKAGSRVCTFGEIGKCTLEKSEFETDQPLVELEPTAAN